MNQQKVILLNKFLFVIVIVLIIYLVVSIVLIFSSKEEYRLEIYEKNDEIVSIDKKSVSSYVERPLSYYKKVSSGRLFRSLISPPSPPKVKKPSKEKFIFTPQEVTFKLIGITWGEERANALIKSSKDHQTHLVSVGDEISGYRVVEITKEAVILMKGNKKKVVGLEYPK
jgi:hypothetical protein